MLTRIQRRIVRDIVVMFFTSLLVITLLVLLIGVAREAMNQGLGLTSIMRLIPYTLPNALSMAVPGTALFSVCSVYGRMSVDNEFVTMQSVGVSLLPSIMPAIFLTTILSVATVGLINVAFTWGFHGIERVVMSSVENIAYKVLERERSFQHRGFSINVRDVQGRDLIEPQIKINRPNSDPVTIVARRAQMTYKDDEQALELRITDGSASVGTAASFQFPNTFVQTIPLAIAPQDTLLTAHPSHMSMRDLPMASLHQREDLLRREHAMAVSVGFGLLTSRPGRMMDSKSFEREAGVTQSRQRLHRLGTEMQRRWASGFTCLAMSMIGIPLAIRMKASDTMTTFGVVFLPTVLVYYPIFALTLDMAKDGRISSAGVWIANAIFIAAAVLLLRRLIYRPV